MLKKKILTRLFSFLFCFMFTSSAFANEALDIQIVNMRNETNTVALSTSPLLFLNQINAYRESHNISGLTLDEELTKIAFLRAIALVNDTSRRGHTLTEFGSPKDTAQQYGIELNAYAENFFFSPDFISDEDAVEQAFDAWQHSDGHRKNMLNTSVNKIGIVFIQADKGLARYNQIAVTVFGD